MVDAYIVSNLQESLGLTDEQFVKALPLVKRLLGERREFAERRREALRELRQMLQSGAATEARVAERLRRGEGAGERGAREDEAQPRRRRRRADSRCSRRSSGCMEVEVEQKIREILNAGAASAGAATRRP